MSQADALIAQELIEGRDLVTVYHATTKHQANRLLRDGVKPGWGRRSHGGQSRRLYAGSSPEEVLSAGYGTHVIGIRVPRHRIEPSPEARDWHNEMSHGALGDELLKKSLETNDVVVRGRVHPSRVFLARVKES